ncbi:MAG: DUF5723 family protein [Bacteroidota bacterium]
MRKLLLASAVALCLAPAAQGQRFLGVATSNWSGTNSVYLNPANIADSRTRVAVDLFSFNLLVDNSLGKLNFSNAINGSATGSGIFNYSNNQKFNMLFPALEARLPGVLVSFNDKHSVALTTRIRGFNQFNNFDKTFYQLITNPPQSDGTPYNVVANNFNWTLHAWTEFKLSYARVVYNEGEHFVKAGLSLNRLSGIGFISFRGNIDAQYYPDNDSLQSTATDIRVQTNILDSAMQLKDGVGDAFSQFFGSKGGNGFGLDWGVVYEFRPDDENSDDQAENKYKLRASISMTDIGSIKYSSRGARVLGNGSMSTGDLSDNFGNYNTFAEYANSRGYFLTDTTPTTTRVRMPMAMVIGADYHAISHLYINGTFFMNLTNRGLPGNSYYNQVSITPRWDTKWFSAGLPITINTMSSLKVGLGLRAAGFIVGSDDMLALLGGSHYGANFYVGGFVPINKKHKKGGGSKAK